MSATEEDLRALWMWDGLSRGDAESQLRGQPAGTFLVRPGSQPDTWTISDVQPNGQVGHVRVLGRGGGFCLNTLDKRTHPSLTALIEDKLGAAAPAAAGQAGAALVLTRALENPAKRQAVAPPPLQQPQWPQIPTKASRESSLRA